MYICICVLMYICTYECIYIYIYAYVHKYMNTHANYPPSLSQLLLGPTCHFKTKHRSHDLSFLELVRHPRKANRIMAYTKTIYLEIARYA